MTKRRVSKHFQVNLRNEQDSVNSEGELHYSFFWFMRTNTHLKCANNATKNGRKIFFVKIRMTWGFFFYIQIGFIK